MRRVRSPPGPMIAGQNIRPIWARDPANSSNTSAENRNLRDYVESHRVGTDPGPTGGRGRWEVGMRFAVRISLLALIACAIAVVSVPAAQASFGVQPRGWFAANCNAEHEGCHIAENPSEEVAKAHIEGYSQAA